jgi:hypothetical protein
VPDLVEGFGHRLEELGDRARVLVGVAVRLVVRELDGRRHDVPVDVAAAAVRVRADVGDRGDHGLQVALEHAVQLEGLARGRAQVALAVLVRQVVELFVHGGRDLAARHLEAEHELVRLLLLLPLEHPVLLHVRAVVLEDVDRVLRDEDLVVAHVRQQRLAQPLRGGLHHLDRLLRLQVGPRQAARRRVRGRRRADRLRELCEQ